MLEPQQTVDIATVAGGAEVDADIFDPFPFGFHRSGRIDAPQFDLGHVDQRQRGLILVGTTARAGVIGRVEDAAGDHQIGGASRFEPAEVTGTRIGQQIVVTRGTTAKGQQIRHTNSYW